MESRGLAWPGVVTQQTGATGRKGRSLCFGRPLNSCVDGYSCQVVRLSHREVRTMCDVSGKHGDCLGMWPNGTGCAASNPGLSRAR